MTFPFPTFAPSSSAAAVSKEAVQTFASASTASSYDFSPTLPATTGAQRYAIIGVAFNAASGTTTISSVTINGQTGSVISDGVTSASHTNGTANGQAMYIASIPTGSGSVTLNVTTADNCNRCGVQMWVVHDLSSTTAQDVATVFDTNTQTLDVATVPDGVVLGIAYAGGDPGITWTGLTEEDKSVLSGTWDHGAASALTTATETRAVQCAYSGGTNEHSIVVSMR